MAKVTFQGIDKLKTRLQLDRNDVEEIGTVMARLPVQKVMTQTNPLGEHYRARKADIQSVKSLLAGKLSKGKRTKTYKRIGDLILYKSGNLLRSLEAGVNNMQITPTLFGWRIQVGTNVPYARYHQEGTKYLPKQDESGWRGFYGFSEDDKKLITNAITRCIRDKNI